MQKIAKWEVFEVSFSVEGDFANPFLDVDLQATFSTAGAKAYTVDGFYDGEENGKHIWRIRFAPMHEGKWAFKTLSNLAALDGIPGDFECTKPVSRGPLTINPQFPNWFSRGDGDAQLIVNDGWFPHTANGKFVPYEDLDFQQPSEEDFNKFVDVLADHKVNMIVGMSELYARQATITDTSFVWPWKIVDAENNKIDKERFNLDFYRRWERNIQHAKDRNLFYAFEVLYDDSLVRPREWNNHPYNVKNGGWLESDEVGDICWYNLFDVNNEKSKLYLGRYIRYTMARLACYWNVCWEIGAENANLAVLPDWMLPNALIPVERVADWFKYWGRYIGLHDPYGRLRTFGDTTYHPLMVRENGNDFVLTQDPRNYPRDDVREYYKAMRQDGVHYWQYCRPMVIGEMNSFNNGNYGRERRMYWTAMTSGFIMARSDRHFGLMHGDVMVESEKFGLDGIPPIYGYLRILYDYVEQNVKFWRMQPANELVNSSEVTCTLAEENAEYLIYFLFGGTAEVDLPASDYEWLDPRTGEIVGKGHVDAGKACFEAPDNSDWVLHITASPINYKG